MPWGYLACYSETLVKLRPVLTGGGLGVVVVVGGLHNVVVAPMADRQVGVASTM